MTSNTGSEKTAAASKKAKAKKAVAARKPTRAAPKSRKADSDEHQVNQNYSRAFEALVEGPDDVVGLLAYANYKMTVREMALNGQETETSARSLTPKTVEIHRSSAELQLTEIVQSGIAEAAPDIRNTATIREIEKNHAELERLIGETKGEINNKTAETKSHIDSRTGFLPSFLTNIAAWIVTIVIAALIIFLANRPSVENTISGAVKKSEASRLDENQEPPALEEDTQNGTVRNKQDNTGATGGSR